MRADSQLTVDLQNLAGQGALDAQPAGSVRVLDHRCECGQPLEVRLGGRDGQQRMDLGREPELVAETTVEERDLAHSIPDRSEAEPIRFEADEAITALQQLQRLRRGAVTQQEPAAADLERRAVSVVDEARDLQSAVPMEGRLAPVPFEACNG